VVVTDASGLVVVLNGRNLRTGGLCEIGRTGTVEGPTVDQSTSSRSTWTGRWPSLVGNRPRLSLRQGGGISPGGGGGEREVGRGANGWSKRQSTKALFVCRFADVSVDFARLEFLALSIEGPNFQAIQARGSIKPQKTTKVWRRTRVWKRGVVKKDIDYDGLLVAVNR